jgi:hypothetical protein
MTQNLITKIGDFPENKNVNQFCIFFLRNTLISPNVPSWTDRLRNEYVRQDFYQSRTDGHTLILSPVLLQNQQAKFNETWCKLSLDDHEGSLTLFK